MWALEQNDLLTNNHAEAANKTLSSDLRKVHPQISECVSKNQERIIYQVLEQSRMVCCHRNCKPPRTNNQTELVLIQVQGEPDGALLFNELHDHLFVLVGMVCS